MPFTIGENLHFIHITDDYEELAAWYDDVFGGLANWIINDGFPYLDVEIRDADLIIIGNTIVEPMAPAKRVPGWDDKPVGRFLNKFGSRWQTMSWYVDDVRAVYDQLAARGVRFFFLGGGGADQGLGDQPAFFTHPKDTYGGLEFVRYATDGRARGVGHDRRFLPGFDPLWWAKNHPLGVERLAYQTVVVEDLEVVKEFYVNGLDGKLLLENTSELTGTKNAYIALGFDCVVELSQPVDPDSVAGQDLAKNGNFLHALTWKVVDLDRAAKHLESKGVGILGRDANTLTTDPATTFGAPHRFTTWSVPGDPRD